MKYLIIPLLFMTNITAYAYTKLGSFTGLWLTEDQETIVNILHCQQTLCGRIVGFIDTGEPYDNLSPDEEKQAIKVLKEICSADLLGGFEKTPEKWVKGWVNDFESGEKYSASLSLKQNDILKLRAYKKLEIFGQSFFWKCINKIPVTCKQLLQ